jgi:hypothetical protein
MQKREFKKATIICLSIFTPTLINRESSPKLKSLATRNLKMNLPRRVFKMPCSNDLLSAKNITIKIPVLLTMKINHIRLGFIKRKMIKMIMK